MIRGLIFDLNGTLIDILTNEWDDNVYRVVANYLDYYGVTVSPELMRDLYFELNKQQRRESREEFPEFDIGRLFREVIERFGNDSTHEMALERFEALAESTATVFRAASRYKLELYPDVAEVLAALNGRYRMAAVSDGQTLWALPELRSVGLAGYFPNLLVSGNLGFRKPDRRMFEWALNQLDLSAREVLFVGNDMYRDVYGAKEAGMRTVFFKSNQGDQENHGAEPDYIIYKFRELPEAIRFLNEKEKAEDLNSK